MDPMDHGIWIDVGDILIRGQKPARNFNEFVAGLAEYDMLELDLLHPENSPVAVDTGVAPYVIRQGEQSNVVLKAQISELHRFEKNLQLRCDCYDQINNRWYVAELAFRNESSHEASIILKGSQPIKDFGAPAPDMKAAFQALYHNLHNPSV